MTNVQEAAWEELKKVESGQAKGRRRFGICSTNDKMWLPIPHLQKDYLFEPYMLGYFPPPPHGWRNTHYTALPRPHRRASVERTPMARTNPPPPTFRASGSAPGPPGQLMTGHRSAALGRFSKPRRFNLPCTS